MDVSLIFINLAITVFAYGLFPIVFALIRKGHTTIGRFRLLCWIVNFVVMIIFLLVKDFNFVNLAPYTLWTLIFVFIGKKIIIAHENKQWKEEQKWKEEQNRKNNEK